MSQHFCNGLLPINLFRKASSTVPAKCCSPYHVLYSSLYHIMLFYLIHKLPPPEGITFTLLLCISCVCSLHPTWSIKSLGKFILSHVYIANASCLAAPNNYLCTD